MANEKRRQYHVVGTSFTFLSRRNAEAVSKLGKKKKKIKVVFE